ncbi:hypothetical protein CHS0354_042117 [Potamilus streckersoni]|uniref:Oxidoreductase FAD/NAD(P)-binding domain-containing protein n=1 Tax=Potamilus streckersoni TaxID=2493646 RepID=A0AAE0TQG3_9BIVA|nr:hypothetical protein CHS0354_042117 [Potamilus streckersoni]
MSYFFNLDKSRSGWGKMYLYFGCRMPQVDEIYSEDLQTAKEEGVLTNVYTIYSREPGKSKMYVQDYLIRNSKEVYNSIVLEKGHFYVCGEAKMAADVTSALETIFGKEGNMSAQDAKNIILKLRDKTDVLKVQKHLKGFHPRFQSLRTLCSLEILPITVHSRTFWRYFYKSGFQKIKF